MSQTLIASPNLKITEHHAQGNIEGRQSGNTERRLHVLGCDLSLNKSSQDSTT